MDSLENKLNNYVIWSRSTNGHDGYIKTAGVGIAGT